MELLSRMGILEIQPERPIEVRRYKVTFRREPSKSCQVQIVTSKCIGRSAAFEDALKKAEAKTPGPGWSVALLEVNESGFQTVRLAVNTVRDMLACERLKYQIAPEKHIDYSEYLPALVLRIKQLECEVEA